MLQSTVGVHVPPAALHSLTGVTCTPRESGSSQQHWSGVPGTPPGAVLPVAGVG